MKDEEIPTELLACDLCGKLIEQGFLYAFHADCLDERDQAESDLRPLKAVAMRDLAPGHPAREILLGLPDKLPAAEVRGIALGLIGLLGGAPKMMPPHPSWGGIGPLN
jgi:hypothetical protein